MYKSINSDSNKMKAKKSFLSKVMKAAWTKFRKGGISWAKAMKSAWAWAKKNLAKTNTAFDGTIKEKRETSICLNLQGHNNRYFKGLPIYYNFWLPICAFVGVDGENVIVNEFGKKLLAEKMQAVNFYTISMAA